MKRRIVSLLMLCALCLSGCSKDMTKEMLPNFNGEAEIKNSMPIYEFVKNDECHDGINLAIEDLEGDNVFLQINVICEANYYEFPGSTNKKEIASEEKFLKSIETDHEIVVSNEEVNSLFADFESENKQVGDGLGITEFSYELKIRTIKYENENWYAGGWSGLGNEFTQSLTNVEYEIDAEISTEEKTETENEFANRIIEIVSEKNVDKLLDECNYPLYINGDIYNTKEDVVNSADILKDYFIETIKQADTNNVLKKGDKYILTSSEYGTPNITYELLENKFLITEINQ